MAYGEATGRAWRARYLGANGKVWRVKDPATGRDALFRTKAAAKKVGLDEEAKIRGGGWIDPSLGKITFADYFGNQWYPNRVVELITLQGYMFPRRNWCPTPWKNAASRPHQA